MASGPEHYREAERLLADQAKVTRQHDDTCPEADRMIAEAKVHALLAVAAATALTGPLSTYSDEPEIEAWVEAAGTPAGGEG